MKLRKKYWLLVLHIQCGEYEFYSKSLHEGEKFDAEDYAKDFYGNLSDEDDGTYYFNGGEVAVQVQSCDEICKKVYTYLINFI